MQILAAQLQDLIYENMGEPRMQDLVGVRLPGSLNFTFLAPPVKDAVERRIRALKRPWRGRGLSIYPDDSEPEALSADTEEDDFVEIDDPYAYPSIEGEAIEGSASPPPQTSPSRLQILKKYEAVAIERRVFADKGKGKAITLPSRVSGGSDPFVSPSNLPHPAHPRGDIITMAMSSSRKPNAATATPITPPRLLSGILTQPDSAIAGTKMYTESPLESMLLQTLDNNTRTSRALSGESPSPDIRKSLSSHIHDQPESLTVYTRQCNGFECTNLNDIKSSPSIHCQHHQLPDEELAAQVSSIPDACSHAGASVELLASKRRHKSKRKAGNRENCDSMAPDLRQEKQDQTRRLAKRLRLEPSTLKDLESQCVPDADPRSLRANVEETGIAKEEIDSTSSHGASCGIFTKSSLPSRCSHSDSGTLSGGKVLETIVLEKPQMKYFDPEVETGVDEPPRDDDTDDEFPPIDKLPSVIRKRQLELNETIAGVETGQKLAGILATQGKKNFSKPRRRFSNAVSSKARIASFDVDRNQPPHLSVSSDERTSLDLSTTSTKTSKVGSMKWKQNGQRKSIPKSATDQDDSAHSYKRQMKQRERQPSLMVPELKPPSEISLDISKSPNLGDIETITQDQATGKIRRQEREEVKSRLERRLKRRLKRRLVNLTQAQATGKISRRQRKRLGELKKQLLRMSCATEATAPPQTCEPPAKITAKSPFLADTPTASKAKDSIESSSETGSSLKEQSTAIGCRLFQNREDRDSMFRKPRITAEEKLGEVAGPSTGEHSRQSLSTEAQPSESWHNALGQQFDHRSKSLMPSRRADSESSMFVPLGPDVPSTPRSNPRTPGPVSGLSRPPSPHSTDYVYNNKSSHQTSTVALHERISRLERIIADKEGKRGSGKRTRSRG
ncbi:hypothetical protein BJ170DRAFT_589179 [Xylariales sp. AK1849]|nr:hypothetical protein BJ170DRAFT_589179 [Xylariales sp. AK1849]